MNKLILIGILVMLVGGGLAIKGHYTEQETHGANILGAELSVTENHWRTIPQWLSVSLFGVGATLTVIGALQGRNGLKI